MNITYVIGTIQFYAGNFYEINEGFKMTDRSY